MIPSAFVYLGIAITLAGLALLLKPVQRVGIPTRRRAAAVAAGGLLTVAILLMLPSREHRVDRVTTRLDEFMPVWQFREYHARRVAAPPDTVYQAIKRVRPDEIFLFRTLIWIRSGGRSPPASVSEAARRYESLIDIATQSTFVYLADDPPLEFVVGTVVGRPPGPRRTVAPEMFREPLPPGFALATMNYVVTPDDAGGSVVSTETRVFANSPSARRRFAAYWRLIYPGSALIRRMTLRAVERRSMSPARP